MKLHKVLVAVIGMTLLSVTVNADELALYAEKNNNEIVINGNFGIENSVITYSILPDNVDRADLTAEKVTEGNYVLGSVMSNNDGEFELVVSLPQGADGGVYTIYADSKGTRASTSIRHINRSQLDKLCAKINSAASKSELKAIMDADYRVLALEECTYVENADNYAEDIFEKSQIIGEFTSDGLLVDTETLFSVYDVNSASDVEAAVKSNAENLGFDYENDFKNLSGSIKNKFKELLSHINNSEDYRRQVIKALINARISEAASYGELKETVLKYASEININTASYKQLNNYQQNQVFQALFTKNPDSIDDISNLFNGCVASVKNNNINPGGNAGGSSNDNSGGGSGSGGVYPNILGFEQKYTNTEQGAAFSDIASHWGKQYIEYLAELGVVSGYDNGEFKPNKNITRAEFAKLVVSAVEPDGSDKKVFRDVNQNDWFYEAVARCSEAGIINGDGGLFRPNDLITREEAAAMLYRATDFSDNGYELGFSDKDTISDYAKDCVRVLCANQIISGDEKNCFNPKSNTTRAEASALIYRILNK